MKTNSRFIKGIINTARKEETLMPWTRGSHRAAIVAKRNAKALLRKTA